MSESSFFSRWSRRKQENQPESEPISDNNAAQEQPAPHSTEAGTPDTTYRKVEDKEFNPDQSEQILLSDTDHDIATSSELSPSHSQTNAPSPQALTDSDMPDISTLDGNSDVSGFFSEDVSENLRKKALKAMFLKPEFNLRDGLEDYDDDFSVMKPLSEKVAASLRNWVDEQDPEEMLEETLNNSPSQGSKDIASKPHEDAFAEDEDNIEEETETTEKKTNNSGETDQDRSQNAIKTEPDDQTDETELSDSEESSISWKKSDQSLTNPSKNSVLHH